MASVIISGTLTVPVRDMPNIAGGSESAWWANIKSGKIAAIRNNGRTLIVIKWVDPAPPREGRPPSYGEYMQEQLVKPGVTKRRAMPAGARNPRRRKVTVEAASNGLQERRGHNG
jgi:hypothetical protein